MNASKLDRLLLLSAIRKQYTMTFKSILGFGLLNAASIVLGNELGSPPQLAEDYTAPPIVAQAATVGLAINTQDRAAVIRFFQTVYRASEDIEIGWNGDVSNCVAGVNSPAYKDATALRINYFRAMAGLPAAITLDNNLNAKCQKAALMMAAQGTTSHKPNATWKCYSADGADAAGHANLFLGTIGPEAIDGYIDDIGGANYFVGHRRWIFYPPQKVMGSGSIPRTENNFWSANALWVVTTGGSRPSKPAWVAWPPQGYIPYQVLPRGSGRWSFSYPKASFKGTTVTMACNGTNVPVTVETTANDLGYADNTLVWIPEGINAWAPAADLTYTVTLKNVSVSGLSKTFAYDVTIIDPEPIALSIRHVDTSQVEIYWPTNPPGYYLWGSDAPGITSGWVMVFPLPKINGSNRSVILKTSNPQEFFRLRK